MRSNRRVGRGARACRCVPGANQVASERRGSTQSRCRGLQYAAARCPGQVLPPRFIPQVVGSCIVYSHTIPRTHDLVQREPGWVRAVIHPPTLRACRSTSSPTAIHRSTPDPLTRLTPLSAQLGRLLARHDHEFTLIEPPDGLISSLGAQGDDAWRAQISGTTADPPLVDHQPAPVLADIKHGVE
jgi:hypothetical protein